MFFMDGTQKKWNCRGKLLHTHLLLFLNQNIAFQPDINVKLVLPSLALIVLPKLLYLAIGCAMEKTVWWNTVKNIHIDIIAPNFTNFYRRIFKIFKIMFFMDGTQKKWNCRGKLLHTHLLLFLFWHFWVEINRQDIFSPIFNTRVVS
jgi:hypothetical protein